MYSSIVEECSLDGQYSYEGPHEWCSHHTVSSCRGKVYLQAFHRALRLLKGNGKLSPNITWKCSCLIGKIL